MRRARPRHARTTVRGKFRYTSAPAFTFTPGKARRVETLCVCGLSYGNSVRNEFTPERNQHNWMARRPGARALSCCGRVCARCAFRFTFDSFQLVR